MSYQFNGQCACGSITYTCDAEPKFTLICQCRQCQRITGTGHSAQFAVDTSNIRITGEVSTYELTSDAGNAVKSAFCGQCGNPIYKTTSMNPDMLVFHAATLDDPSAFKPQMVVFSSSSQPWDHIDPSQPWDHIDPSIERKG